MILTEYYPLILTPQQLNEAMDVSAGAPMVIKKVLLQKANTKNRNGRIYPRPILEREIDRYNNDFVKARRSLGELDHRDSPEVRVQNVSHLISEMWWEGDDVYGNVEILDGEEFPSGRILAGLLKRKIPVGISSRALGSTTDTNEGTMVNDDLQLSCFDAVSYESTIGSTMNLNESFTGSSLRFEKFDSILYEIICANSHASIDLIKNKTI